MPTKESKKKEKSIVFSNNDLMGILKSKNDNMGSINQPQPNVKHEFSATNYIISKTIINTKNKFTEKDKNCTGDSSCISANSEERISKLRENHQEVLVEKTKPKKVEEKKKGKKKEPLYIGCYISWLIQVILIIGFGQLQVMTLDLELKYSFRYIIH